MRLVIVLSSVWLSLSLPFLAEATEAPDVSKRGVEISADATAASVCFLGLDSATAGSMLEGGRIAVRIETIIDSLTPFLWSRTDSLRVWVVRYDSLRIPHEGSDSLTTNLIVRIDSSSGNLVDIRTAPDSTSEPLIFDRSGEKANYISTLVSEEILGRSTECPATGFLHAARQAAGGAPGNPCVGRLVLWNRHSRARPHFAEPSPVWIFYVDAGEPGRCRGWRTVIDAETAKRIDDMCLSTYERVD